MTTVFEADLAEAANPFLPADDACPWSRHATVDHTTWAATLGPQLIVADQAVARTILADPCFRPGARVAMQQNPAIDPRFLSRRLQTLLLRDGPDHTRMRNLSARAFTPRATDRHRPFMREVMERLADQVPGDGRCDAVATLTRTYPIFVICQVLGAPAEDVPMFSRVAETILSAQSGAPEWLEAGLSAHDELDSYVVELIERRRSDPRPDLLSDLIAASEDGGRLTTEEMLHIVVSVIMAGTDTTRNQLAIGLHLLADHPEQWESLSQPGRLETAVEEILRFAPIGHALTRVPDADVTIRDLVIPASTMVVLNVGAVNRNDVVDANAFDARRDPSPQHLTFGFGPKYCMGANLARAEMVEALSVLRGRFTAIAHDGPARFRRVGFIDGPVELPLCFTHASVRGDCCSSPLRMLGRADVRRRTCSSRLHDRRRRNVSRPPRAVLSVQAHDGPHDVAVPDRVARPADRGDDRYRRHRLRATRRVRPVDRSDAHRLADRGRHRRGDDMVVATGRKRVRTAPSPVRMGTHQTRRRRHAAASCCRRRRAERDCHRRPCEGPLERGAAGVDARHRGV